MYGVQLYGHPYYVYNSPINYIDPNGMWTVDKDGNVHSDNAAEAQDFIRALQDRAAYNEKKGIEGAGYGIYVDSYEGGNKGDEAFRMISKEGNGGLVQIFHQRTDKGTSHKHSKGEAWSVGGSFIFGAGAEFSIGMVEDGYGESKWFWNINAGFGLDVGIGGGVTDAYSIKRERPFRVSDWAGRGAEASIGFGFGDYLGASASTSYNINTENNADLMKAWQIINPKSVGATYRTIDAGIGIGPSSKAFDIGLPVDLKYAFGATKFFE